MITVSDDESNNIELKSDFLVLSLGFNGVLMLRSRGQVVWHAVFREFRVSRPIFPENTDLNPALINFCNVQMNTNSNRVKQMIVSKGAINFSLLNYIEHFHLTKILTSKRYMVKGVKNSVLVGSYLIC